MKWVEEYESPLRIALVQGSYAIADSLATQANTLKDTRTGDVWWQQHPK